MKNKKMQDMITAAILAVVLWITLIYINNPETSVKLISVPVECTGTEALADRGLAVNSLEGFEPVSVEVSGKRSDLIDQMDSVYVEVDVSQVEGSGEYELEASTQLPSTRLRLEKDRYGKIPVIIEKRMTKEIQVRIKQTGTNKGKLIKSVPASTLTVSGAASIIDDIAYAQVSEDITNITEDDERELPFELISRSESVIENDSAIDCKTSVTVNNYVYNAVTLPVSARLTGEEAQNYTINEEKLNITPSSIEVGVREGADVQTVYVEISAANSAEQTCMPVENEDIYIPPGKTSIKVKAEFIPNATPMPTPAN